MSGFSPDWLALREPADHAARDVDLVRRLADHLAPSPEPLIVDLGCGTGSNLRALAPHLGPRQRWRLVDHDPRLLAAARRRLAAWAGTDWAGTEPPTEGGCRLHVPSARDGSSCSLDVAFVQADLTTDLDAVLEGADLVTAAALFDLASESWIERFAALVAGRGAAFYTALTYDGRETWRPPHRLDEAVHRAFLAHQGRDKGFGPSAGPGASEALAAAFRRAGYRVDLADSPWRLGAADAELVRELALGIAAAVEETGLVGAAELNSWRDARASGAACLVGHLDCLALP